MAKSAFGAVSSRLDQAAHRSLTEVDDAEVDTTYGADEAGVIENTRTRVQEIEAVLIELGILSAPPEES